MKSLFKKSKKKNRLINVLWGLYDALCAIYLGCSQDDDEIESSILSKQHILYLMMFHETFVKDNKIDVIKMDGLYQKYRNEWNTFILSKEPKLQEACDQYQISKKVPTYIS